VSEDAAAALPEVPAEQFFAVDIRVGRVVSCEPFPEARKPAYKMVIDFGPLGTRRSSARFTDLYQPEDLVGRLVIGTVNLPARQIGPVRSQTLILGAYQHGSDAVVLLTPDRDCTPGDKIG
jgi:tRNA-binding protein